MIATATQVPAADVTADKTVVLFDGVCNFCNATINFLIDRDPTDRFRFAAQQSNIGQKVMQQHGLTDLMLNTIIVLDNGKMLTESGGALRLARYMPFPWRLLSWLAIVPPFLRNWGYRLVAKNRYKMLGQADACRMPTPEIRAKFL